MAHLGPRVLPRRPVARSTAGTRIVDELGAIPDALRRRKESKEQRSREDEEREIRAAEMALQGIVEMPSEINPRGPGGFEQSIAGTQPPSVVDPAAGLPGNFNFMTGTFNPVRPEALGGAPPGQPGVGVPGDQGFDFDRPQQPAELPLEGRDQPVFREDPNVQPIPGTKFGFDERLTPEGRRGAREEEELDEFVGAIGGTEALGSIRPEVIRAIAKVAPGELVDRYIEAVEQGDFEAENRIAFEALREIRQFASITFDERENYPEILRKVSETQFERDLGLRNAIASRQPAADKPPISFDNALKRAERFGDIVDPKTGVITGNRFSPREQVALAEQLMRGENPFPEPRTRSTRRGFGRLDEEAESLATEAGVSPIDQARAMVTGLSPAEARSALEASGFTDDEIRQIMGE